MGKYRFTLAAALSLFSLTSLAGPLGPQETTFPANKSELLANGSVVELSKAGAAFLYAPEAGRRVDSGIFWRHELFDTEDFSDIRKQTLSVANKSYSQSDLDDVNKRVDELVTRYAASNHYLIEDEMSGISQTSDGHYDIGNAFRNIVSRCDEQPAPSSGGAGIDFEKLPGRPINVCANLGNIDAHDHFSVDISSDAYHAINQRRGKLMAYVLAKRPENAKWYRPAGGSRSSGAGDVSKFNHGGCTACRASIRIACIG